MACSHLNCFFVLLVLLLGCAADGGDGVLNSSVTPAVANNTVAEVSAASANSSSEDGIITVTGRMHPETDESSTVLSFVGVFFIGGSVLLLAFAVQKFRSSAYLRFPLNYPYSSLNDISADDDDDELANLESNLHLLVDADSTSESAESDNGGGGGGGGGGGMVGGSRVVVDDDVDPIDISVRTGRAAAAAAAAVTSAAVLEL